jgi:hypothetical protein
MQGFSPCAFDRPAWKLMRGVVRPGSIEGLGLRVRSYRTEPAMLAFVTSRSMTPVRTYGGNDSVRQRTECCGELGRRFD